MIDEKTIYEQRQSTLRSGSLPEYIRQVQEEWWPSLNAAGGQVVCLINGLIGQSPEEVIQISRFPDWDTWARSQSYSILPGHDLVEKEEAKLLKSIASRPKSRIPPEDRRAVYGYRRFFIRPADLEEFVHCSEQGIWPRIETQGACILGLWTTAVATDPQEVVLLTGYEGPAHWEETRDSGPLPANFDPGLWENSVRLATRRRELTIKSWVCLMRAIEVAPTG
ncbi:MAG: hypothetical protein ACE5Q6_12990 [Dehalococcoidia bacterium]